MAWRIVKQPNGLYARWSDAVDNFTDYDMTLREAKILCVRDYSMDDAEACKKISNADAEPARFGDCVDTIFNLYGRRAASAWARRCSKKTGA